MFIDMHLHEKTFSEDSHVSLQEIVEEAKAKGLDAVCITDHDSMGLQAYAEQFSAETGFPIFVGAEVLTVHGDMTVFGVEALPDMQLAAQELIDYAAARGGACIAAHPFRDNGRGIGHLLYTLKGLHGLESLNGNTKDGHNALAHQTALALKVPQFGASDAHHKNEVGRYATYFPTEKMETVQELVFWIASGESKPALHTDKGYTLFQPMGQRSYEKPAVASAITTL